MHIYRVRRTFTPKPQQRKLTGLQAGTYQLMIFANYPLLEVAKEKKLPDDLEQRTYVVVDGRPILVGNRNVVTGKDLEIFEEKVQAMLFGNPLRCAARTFGSKAGVRYSPTPKKVQAVPEPVSSGEDVSVKIC